jgi:hypothetical protein
MGWYHIRYSVAPWSWNSIYHQSKKSKGEMKKIGIIALIIGGAGLLTWTAVTIYKNVMLLLDYCFNPVGYRIISLSLKRFLFEVDLQIKNKSDINVYITGYNFKIYVDGKFATTVHSSTDAVTGGPLRQLLKAKDFSILTLQVDFDPKDVFKAVASVTEIQKAILKPEDMLIGFDGTVSIEVEGVAVKDYAYKDAYSLKYMLPDKDNPSPPCK